MEAGQLAWLQRLKKDLPEAPPRVTVTISEADLAAHLAALESDALDAFPGTQPAEAAYRLFLVHVDELINTCDHDELDIQLIDGELRAQ